MQDIIATFHPRHVLKEIDRKVSKSWYGKLCVLCGRKINFRRSYAYCCSICEFSFHEECATTLMESNFTINRPKIHEHTLTFIRKKNSFICDACGVDVDGHKMNCMYGCLLCDFFVHKHCLDLPKVIKITLHSHRLFHTFQLFGGNMSCQYCFRQLVSGYGGYICIDKRCDYKLHSHCATNRNVWDGKDVEGEPEQASNFENVVSPSLEEIDGKIYRHFSHEHDLMRLCVNDEDKDGRICQACILPIDFDSFLCCKEGDFALHDTCAILPRKMEHVLHRHPLLLQVDMRNTKEGFFTCSKCDRESCGFMYRCCLEQCGFKLDAKCASLTNPIYHVLHQHPLSLMKTWATCQICHHFDLNIRTATLPLLVRCKYEIHPLSVCLSSSISEYNWDSYSFWCDICEKRLNQEHEVFYRCDDCNTTLHVECVIGKYPYLKSGHRIIVNGLEVQISSNDCFSRPICDTCHSICEDKLFFKGDGVCFCSINCIYSSTEAIGNLMLAECSSASNQSAIYVQSACAISIP